jgi:hypothetical protein
MVHKPANACMQAKITKRLDKILNFKLSEISSKLKPSVKTINPMYPRNRRK